MFTALSRILALSLVIIFLSAESIFAGADDWRPVTAAELEAKTPQVEPGADAEAIFWEVKVDDDNLSFGLSRLNYVRVKIFTERGREMFAKYDIRYTRGFRIKDVEARVTRPDGTTAFLKKEDVFEREVIKADGYKVKAKSFAVPGLVIGSILDFRFRETSDFGLGSMPLIFQRDIPIQTITYYVQRHRGRATMYAQGFNVGDTWFEEGRNGFKQVTMTNLRAFKREPDMPPENELRSWMHLYYSLEPNVKKPDIYWKNFSDEANKLSKGWMKVTDDIKKTADEVTAGAANDEEKLKKIYEFTQQRIKNLSYSRQLDDEESKDVKGELGASEILKEKMGNSVQVDLLFGALARGAGFDARIAYTGDRNDISFDPGIANVGLMISSSLIAVKNGESWRFFHPGNFDMPFGMVGWRLEGQTALIATPDELLLKQIPVSPSANSQAKRSGRFKLLPDGTLEGEARIEFTGNLAAYHKAVNRFDSVVEQEKTLRNYAKAIILDTAEVESISIANVENDKKPFIYSFKLKVSNYAARTGKRIFFQPGIFKRNAKARFTSSARSYDVYFEYPWSEQDDIAIELPAEFSLENADSPATIADRSGIAKLETQMFLSKDRKVLFYKRRFSFGNDEAIRFPASAYPVLKDMFESFNKSDVHQLTLREGAQASAGSH